MQFGIRGEILRLGRMGLLEELLFDRTTRRGILWATDAYASLGDGYRPAEEMTAAAITGAHSDLIRTRALKALEQQSARTRKHAEVFTPLWICEKMISHADSLWWGGRDPFREERGADGRLVLPKKKTWKRYIDSRRLEITCGEAPYLAQPYDVSTGEILPLSARGGLLDRKLRLASEYAETETEWLTWAFRAAESVYGYEFQGDNLLIARLNFLLTFENYLQDRWKRTPTEEEYAKLLRILTWNIWQMDGLTGTVPYAEEGQDCVQGNLFDEPAEAGDLFEKQRPKEAVCRIYDWRRENSLVYRDIADKRRRNMTEKKKERNICFDFIIGNPPYQEGDSESTRKSPVYNLFMDAVYELADEVELITPARFLFEAGQTPKAWNKKMLEDPHLKVLYYEADGEKVFPGTDIKGGVAITYRNAKKDFGAIKSFTAFDELRDILQKVLQKSENFLDGSISQRGCYRFSDTFFKDHPEVSKQLESGTGNMIVSNIFDKFPDVFHTEHPDDGNEYVKLLGRVGKERAYRYIKRKYVLENDFIDTYNVLVPSANGSGAIGEVLSTPLIGQPLIGQPLIGHTDTFLSIGQFDNKSEAEACLKYIKSRFARTMLGILKATQHNPPAVWRYVPLQDFTADSDIDWSQSVSDIDRQLYEKYGLGEEEISFIESHVKEMK